MGCGASMAGTAFRDARNTGDLIHEVRKHRHLRAGHTIAKQYVADRYEYTCACGAHWSRRANTSRMHG